MQKFIHVITLALCLVSCSIKENRTECPCFLDISVSGGDESRAEVSIWSKKGELEAEFGLLGGGIDSSFVFPKTEAVINIRSGRHNCILEGSDLIIPLGHEMDELYAYSSCINTATEELRVDGQLHKQFAFVHIILEGVDPEEYPYSFHLKGNIRGINLKDLTPLPGAFDVPISPVMGLYHRVATPRQADDSLMLEVELDEKTKVGEVAIGKMISRTGYDWQDEDLQDIYIDLQWSDIELCVDVEDWIINEL